jgi:proprotein convertase subtilisin/kexin type 5
MRPERLCYLDCLSRYYPDSNTKSCILCPYDCLTCQSNGTCLSCDTANDHRSLNIANGRCIPLQGYFDTHISACGLCPAGCSACSNLTFCSNCQDNYFLRGDNICYQSCLNRFFPDPTLKTCRACPFDCQTCLPSGNCLTCDAYGDHRALDNGTSRCLPLSGFF